jgi:SAM-dependent methyltransferase
MSQSERDQRRHYDSLAASYDAHYSDPTSERYRDRFLNNLLTRGVPLDGCQVLEAFCGGGSTTRHLLAMGANVTGLDISGAQIAEFRRRWPTAKAVHGSILGSGLGAESFDAVVIVGGLHHVQPHLDEAIDEIWRILKPGGFLCFAEPHAGSLPDLFRRRWYKVDRLFEEDERSIDITAFENKNESRFEFASKRYGGNLAYLVVLNSLILRIPLAWKPYYAPLAFKFEAVMSAVQTRWLSCFIICQWRKAGGA